MASQSHKKLELNTISTRLIVFIALALLILFNANYILIGSHMPNTYLYTISDRFKKLNLFTIYKYRESNIEKINSNFPAVNTSSNDIFINNNYDIINRNIFLKEGKFNLYVNEKAQLRILTHNVYGLKKSECESRAKQFGSKVARADPKYDIVGVQEYYSSPDNDWKTCDSEHLSEAIWSTGRYKNSNNYYRFYPEVSWAFDGGVGIFTLHPIKKFDDWQWSNDDQGTFEAKEGFIFARIEIPFTNITVDTYVVHLNSGANNRDRRKKQLQQLTNQITNLSSKSGNPVIVMGDFNIGGPPTNNGNAGYEDIMRILKQPKDLWLSAHPNKAGFTYDCQNNNLAKAGGCKGQERIDYIFVITNRALTNSPYQVSLVSKDDIKIVEWQVPKVIDHRSNSTQNVKDHRSKFISDHFGLEASIIIEKKEVRDHRN